MLTNICKTNEILVPDMPVAGTDYFDKAFYNSHYSEIKTAYDSLSDDISKSAFAAIVNYKLFGKMEYLLNCYSPVDSLYELIPENIEIAIDAGAYNGDTLREILSYRKDIKKIYAVEPDKRNFKKLSRYIEEAELSDKAEAICAAVWSENSSGIFIGSGNRNSSVSSTASHESREEETRLLAIDSISAPYVDYIKLDVEGAELAALEGARKTIEKHSPTLLISAYHRSEDIFSLVLYMRKNHPDYSLYIRRTLCLPAWEIALIAVNHKNG
jgi:FkbM family methyltransferase